MQASELKIKQINEDELLSLIATLPAKKSKYCIAAEKESLVEVAKNSKKAEKVILFRISIISEAQVKILLLR